MPRLYLVRHAEPGKRGVLLGRSDPPLSERGRECARGLLRDVALKVVYTSPLRRALETAEAFAGAVPVEVWTELAEISYGEWDGLAWDEIAVRYPDLARRKERDWRDATPPGGELWGDFERRVDAAWQRIVAGPFPAAVVAHCAVNAILANRACGADPFRFTQDHCGIYGYDIPD